MSFSEKKKLPSSDKFYMVRMQCGILLNKLVTRDYEYTFSGTTYTLFRGFLNKNVRVKESIMRVIDPFPSATNYILDDQSDDPNPFPTSGSGAGYDNAFKYDPTTGEFQLFTSATLSGMDGSFGGNGETLMLEFYIFFTQYVGKYARFDMTDFDLDVNQQYWSPRIPKDVDLDFSQENNLVGQLSISSSSIPFSNQDHYFNDFFTVNHSFNNREVMVWRCINSIENYQFEFSAVIKGATLDDKDCLFELTDSTGKLDETVDATYKTFFDLNDGSGYVVRQSDQALPYYRIIGVLSPFDLEFVNVGMSIPLRRLSENKTLQAVCTSYDGASKTTSTNRKWSLHSGPTTAANLSKAVTAVANAAQGTFLMTKFTMNALGGFPNTYLAEGDTILNNGNYATVVDIIGLDVYVWPRNAAFNTSNLNRAKAPAVTIIQNDLKYYPMAIRDYTCSIGSKGDLAITFVNNFEANHSGLGTLDPDSASVYGRVWNDGEDFRASAVAKLMLDECGLSTAIDFMPDQAPVAWDDPYLSFTIPFVGDQSFPTYREVMDVALRSSFGFIYMDSEGLFRYKSFLNGINVGNIDNQSGQDPDESINQTNSKGWSVKFDLYDAFVGVNFQLPNRPNVTYGGSSGIITGQDWIFGRSANETRLLKSNRLLELISVIDTHYNPGLLIGVYLQSYNNLVTGRSAYYSTTAHSRHFEYWIGDDVLVERKNILGEQSQYMRIIAVAKGSNTSQMKLVDLKRFTTS